LGRGAAGLLRALGWAEAEGREGPGLRAKHGEGGGFFSCFFCLFPFCFFFLFQSLFKAVSKQFKNILTLLKITQ